YVVGRAAVRYFLENAPKKFVPKEPKMDDKKTFLTVVLTSGLYQRLAEYAALQHTSRISVVRQALYDFLKLAKSKQYDAILTQAAEEKKQKEESSKERLKWLEQLQPNMVIPISFKYDTKLHKILYNETIKEKQSLAYIVKRAVAEFLQKYDSEEIRKLIEKDGNLIGKAQTCVKMPAEYVLKLTKLAEEVQASRSALIRIAIAEYLKSRGQKV
ncbi:MAG: ribbon-helix-helix protein, CopG family, partial [Thermoplasmatales archaeon]